jgi:hypothetical protein
MLIRAQPTFAIRTFSGCCSRNGSQSVTKIRSPGSQVCLARFLIYMCVYAKCIFLVDYCVYTYVWVCTRVCITCMYMTNGKGPVRAFKRVYNTWTCTYLCIHRYMHTYMKQTTPYGSHIRLVHKNKSNIAQRDLGSCLHTLHLSTCPPIHIHFDMHMHVHVFRKIRA